MHPFYQPLTNGDCAQVMGILNVTPDSFSDGGEFAQLESAMAQAKQMLDAGASIIDVGGESTRPGAQAVDIELELQRVLPAIKALKQQFNCRVSIDTSKAEVMREAVAAQGVAWGPALEKKILLELASAGEEPCRQTLAALLPEVPLTAAIRIVREPLSTPRPRRAHSPTGPCILPQYLERLSHPLPRWVANTLAGKGDSDDDAAQVKPL